MNAAEEEELKAEIRDNPDNLAVALAFGVDEAAVKALRESIEPQKEIMAAKEAKVKKVKPKEENVPKFYLKDPATGLVTELKRINSSCNIHLLVH